jgi:hypothetical protein
MALPQNLWKSLVKEQRNSWDKGGLFEDQVRLALDLQNEAKAKLDKQRNPPSQVQANINTFSTGTGR